MEMSEIVNKHLSVITDQLSKLGGNAPEIWREMVGRQIIVSSMDTLIGIAFLTITWFLVKWLLSKKDDAFTNDGAFISAPGLVIVLSIILFFTGLNCLFSFADIFYPQAAIIDELIKPKP